MCPSQNEYSPQSFESFWQPLVRLFQIFGVSHYSIFCSSRQYDRFVHFIIISALDVAINTYTLAHIYLMDEYIYVKSPLMYYTSCLSIFCHVVAHGAIHLEAFFLWKHERAIYRRFREINETFTAKLNCVEDFNAKQKQCVSPTINYFATIAALQMASSVYFHPSSTSTLAFVLGRLFVTLISCARKCQISIYVNYLTSVLNELKMLLERERRSSLPRTNQSPFQNLHQLREIYSNAWIISKLLSSCFGWTLLIYLIEFTIDLINSSYQVYLNFKIDKSTYKMIRNYSVLQKRCSNCSV